MSLTQFVIYKATSPNGKSYIGLTSNFSNRKYQHYYDAKNLNHNRPIHNAIRKYENKITWEILEKGIGLKWAQKAEKRWIREYNTHNNGYNLTLGGEGRLIWDKQSILKEAKKHQSKVDWSSRSKSSYEAARAISKHFFTICSNHMINPLIKWTDELIIKEAKKYKTQSEWKKACPYSYKLSYEKDDFSFRLECVKHMKKYKIKWTKDEIIKRSRMYKTKSEWERLDNKSFQAAKTLNKKQKDFYNECTKHMKVNQCL